MMTALEFAALIIFMVMPGITMTLVVLMVIYAAFNHLELKFAEAI